MTCFSDLHPFQGVQEWSQTNGLFGLSDLRKLSLSDVERKKLIYLPREITNIRGPSVPVLLKMKFKLIIIGLFQLNDMA